MRTGSRLRQWVKGQAESYRHGEDRPLGGYLVLLGGYAGTAAAGGVLVRSLGRSAPTRIGAWELAQLALATQKVARTIAKDPITSPLRAPFTRYEGTSAPAELAESVRAHSAVGHAAGELVTCPMCLAQWVASTFVLGLAVAPNVTRVALTTFTAVAGADFLQHLYVLLQKATE